MKNPVILLVDDYEPTNILHKEYIKMHLPDATVHYHTDPYLALRSLKNPKLKERIVPNIIFLDINMPSMSGWEFLEAFSVIKIENKESIEIYVLSTFDDPKYRKKAEANLQVKSYFTKPLTEVILKETIANK